MLRRLVFTVLLAWFPAGLAAQGASGAAELVRALGLPEIIEIMQEEGLDYGRSIEEDMFPGRGSDSWEAIVRRIYDPGKMLDTIADGLDDDLTGAEMAPVLEFFTSSRGRRIVAFEVSARRALLDPDIEEAARERYAELRDEGEPRLELLDRFAEVNGLVDYNVMGAMNASYAFYMGLIDGGAMPDDMTEGQVLMEVWSQEPMIRQDTEDWLFTFLAMAYQPLPDEDVEAYIALSESPEGQALNAALFAAFDRMYVDISRALGLAASRFIVGEDI